MSGYRARLVIDVDDPRQVELVAEKLAADTALSFTIALDGIEIGIEGEMIRHALKPLRVEATSEYGRSTIGARPRKGSDERGGPLIRIYATRPTEEEHGNHERSADAAGA